MDYEAKYVEENFNVSKTSDLAEFIKYILVILIVFVVLFSFSGWLVDVSVYALPKTIENSLGKVVTKKIAVTKNNKDLNFVNEIFIKLIKKSSLYKDDYEILITNDKQPNAFAAPGGKILITKSLLKLIDNEEELAFVIAHELGHFNNKDHLKSFGRTIIALLVTGVVFSQNSEVYNFIENSISLSQMKYSQNQEKAADLYAIDLLYKTYGSTLGATEFMNKLVKREKLNELVYFFASHPHPKKRLEYLESYDKNISISN